MDPTATKGITFDGRSDRAKALGWLSDAGWDMTHGVWDHFKGGVYRSTAVALCVDTEKAKVCYENEAGRKFVRDVDSWNELVQWPDGEWRSRFVRRSNPVSVPSFKVQKKE